MTEQERINEVFKQLMEPVGGQVRTFCTDYRDDSGEYYNEVSTMYQPPGVVFNPATLTTSLIESVERRGYTVYAICEILDGYTSDELEALAEKNPIEARKHYALIYADFRKEATP